jgi:phosphatidylglycerophosphatase A
MKNLKQHELIITFFNCGKFKYGPGTLTSFLCLPIWVAVNYCFNLAGFSLFIVIFFWLLLLTSLFYYGVHVIPFYAKKMQDDDHSSIVVDEVVGQLLTLCLTYPVVIKYYFKPGFTYLMIFHLICGFITFRFFDIFKPFIIGVVDRNIKNSMGVMLDDVVASIIAALLTNIVIIILIQFFINL